MCGTAATGAAPSRERSICVGTITRGRPLMLRNLLNSYVGMRVPAGVRLDFVIVENNDSFTLQDIVTGFRERMPQWSVRYELEPRLGIAFARNSVLDCALGAGNDLLTFADDDEAVEPDWLVQLLAERDAFNLDIVGSPVRIAPAAPDASRWQRLVWSGIDRMNRHSEAKLLRRRNNGKVEQIPIATGSWMGSLSFLRRTGLRFETGLGLAGGEDGLLWAEARKLGANTGWTPFAVAYETVPEDRLSLFYRYKRSRDETIAKFRKRLDSPKRGVLLRLPGSLMGRMLSLCLCVTTIPFTRGQTLVRAAWYVGSIAGIIQACMGRTSLHYEHVTGS